MPSTYGSGPRDRMRRVDPAAHPLLSIVIPAFNEEDSIGRGVLRQLADYLATQDFSWEVLSSTTALGRHRGRRARGGSLPLAEEAPRQGAVRAGSCRQPLPAVHGYGPGHVHRPHRRVRAGAAAGRRCRHRLKGEKRGRHHRSAGLPVPPGQGVQFPGAGAAPARHSGHPVRLQGVPRDAARGLFNSLLASAGTTRAITAFDVGCWYSPPDGVTLFTRCPCAGSTTRPGE
jgi:hypothetical protein